MPVELVDGIAGDGDVHDVAVLDHDLGPAQLRDAEARKGDDPRPLVEVEITHAVTRPLRLHDALDEAHLSTGVDPFDGGRLREDAAQHPLDGPLHGGDGRDAEAFVDRRSARVVDAGDDPVDVVGLLGDAGDHDVRVVTVRHRGNRDRITDARLVETVAVEADTDDALAREPRVESPEGGFLAIDDGDGVTRRFDGLRETGPHSATADHDDMHDGAWYRRPARP